MGKLKPQRMVWRWCARIFLLPLLAVSVLRGAPDADYKIDPALMEKLADDEGATAPFFVVFGERPQLEQAYRIPDRLARARFVGQALRATADRSQAGVRRFLQARVVAFTAFWIENKIFVPSGTLELASRPGREAGSCW